MSKDEPKPPVDPLWTEFDKTQEIIDQAQELAYQQVEEYNRRILNQIAGLEVVEFKLPGDPASNPLLSKTSIPREIKLNPSFARLYLRPDRIDELYEQGESSLDIELNGSPYVVNGELPDRTRQLIDDLLSGVEASIDTTKSTEMAKVYRGNVAGQPIGITLYRKNLTRTSTGENEKATPFYSFVAYTLDD